MQQNRAFSDKLFLILKGMAMGMANKVPGVSGGVVAYVAGFYEEFIFSLQQFDKTAFRLLYKLQFKRFWQHVNGAFLSLLILGSLISFFSVSLLLDAAIHNFPVLVWSTFFGMIIGSVLYLKRDFGKWSVINIVFLILGILVGVGISLIEPAVQNDTLWFVFICGVISVSGMTLPGLSGSFLLMLLGNYVLLLVDAVNNLYRILLDVFVGDLSLVYNPERVRLLEVLFVFTLGSCTGLISLSHFLGFLLKRFKQNTNALILGFIAGSLGVVWPWKKELYEIDKLGNKVYDTNGDAIIVNFERFIPQALSWELLWAIILMAVGLSFVLILGKYGPKATRA